MSKIQDISWIALYKKPRREKVVARKLWQIGIKSYITLRSELHYYRNENSKLIDTSLIPVYGFYILTKKILQAFYDALSNIKQSNLNSYSLFQNYPNPFNSGTVIRYSMPRRGHVILKVHNILGEEVATLVNEVKQAGNYTSAFDATNITSGIYFYKLQSGNHVETKKIILR